MTETDENSGILIGAIVDDLPQTIQEYIQHAIGSDQHQKGIYYFAILASACYLESVLEDFCNNWCISRSYQDSGFQRRLMNTIAHDVSRATGLDAWNKWLRVLFDIDVKAVIGDDWEPLVVLFKLRNQLAHGRTTKFPHFWNADGRFLGLTLEGSSYEAPFKHLIDKGLIQVGKGTSPSSKSLLTRSVAQYFWEVVERAILSLKNVPELSSLRHESSNGKA